MVNNRPMALQIRWPSTNKSGRIHITANNLGRIHHAIQATIIVPNSISRIHRVVNEPAPSDVFRR